MKIFLPKYKILLIPASSMLILVILLAIGIKIVLAKVKLMTDEMANIATSANVLEANVAVLQNVQREVIPLTEKTILALPSQNPVLSAMSQLKSLASARGLLLENIKVGGESKGDTGTTSRVEITFNLQGSFSGVTEFLKGLGKITPIIRIEKVQIDAIGADIRANTTISAYFSEFPKLIGAKDKPISDLTEEEKTILSSLSALNAPQSEDFSLPLSPIPSSRTDPFNF